MMIIITCMMEVIPTMMIMACDCRYQHIMLDPETGLDPAGIRVRAIVMVTMMMMMMTMMMMMMIPTIMMMACGVRYQHMMLDPETGLDPPGIRVRAIVGLEAAAEFLPCELT
jgi:hypothetical protein